MPVVTGPSYATLTDFERFGLPRSSIPALTNATIEAQLEKSSRKIDSALSRFSPPLAEWGTDIVEAVCLDAAWTLTRAQGVMHPSYDDKSLSERYRLVVYDAQGLAWLQRVAKGEFTPSNIVDATPDEAEMGAIGWSDGDAGARGWTTPGGSIP